MNRKIILIVLNCVLGLVLLVMGFFAYQTYVERERETFIREKQEAFQPLVPAIMEENKLGEVYTTVYFPTDAAGKRIPVLEEYLQMIVKEVVGNRPASKETKELFFLATKEVVTSFTGVRKVEAISEDYGVKGLSIKPRKSQTGKPIFLTAENQVFTLETLVKDKAVFMTLLKKQVETDLRAKQVMDAEIRTALTTLDQVAIDQLEFSYANSQLTIELSEPLVGLETITMPVSTLFSIIESKYLARVDQEAYASYLAAEEAKKNQKRIALTFDDGPNAATTPQILAILKKYKVKATFFVLGSSIAGNETILKQIVADGHEIGNHTWNHPNLTQLTPEQVRQEIQQTQDTIFQVTGQRPKIMRPPYGAIKASVIQSVGLPAINWSVDSQDWHHRDKEAILKEVKQACQPGGIILMHDIHQTTVDALPAVLEYLQKEGYGMVTTSDLLGKDLNPHLVYYDQEIVEPAPEE